MPKRERTGIPKAVSEQVLKEFNHRCAKCGEHSPQLHHIDEDPSNGYCLNLLPLCPNCHLRDQHNPTAPVDTAKLKLFRRFKDPAILHSKFEPIWQRCRYLLDAEQRTPDSLAYHGDMLVQFLRCFALGKFYGDMITRLVCCFYDDRGEVLNARDLIRHHETLKRKLPPGVTRAAIGPSQWTNENKTVYRENVVALRDATFGLIVEQLRYQDWLADRPAPWATKPSRSG